MLQIQILDQYRSWNLCSLVISNRLLFLLISLMIECWRTWRCSQQDLHLFILMSRLLSAHHWQLSLSRTVSCSQMFMNSLSISSVHCMASLSVCFPLSSLSPSLFTIHFSCPSFSLSLSHTLTLSLSLSLSLSFARFLFYCLFHFLPHSLFCLGLLSLSFCLSCSMHDYLMLL